MDFDAIEVGDQIFQLNNIAYISFQGSAIYIAYAAISNEEWMQIRLREKEAELFLKAYRRVRRVVKAEDFA